MASMWRKAMLYLGLGPDDEYDDFDVTGEQSVAPQLGPGPGVGPAGRARARCSVTPSPAARCAPSRPAATTTATATATATRAGEDLTGDVSPGREHGATRRGSDGDRTGHAAAAGVLRSLAPGATTKPFVVGPTSFNDAQDVADKFKVNVPVILNLQGVDRDLSRRIIDFASGLCYGLGGQMERVANQVYLLTPNDVEVSLEERRRLHERGYEA